MRALALNDDVLNFVHDARVIVFSLDLAGNISVWNRQAALLTGYSAEDIIGSPLQVKLPIELNIESSNCRKFELWGFDVCCERCR